MLVADGVDIVAAAELAVGGVIMHTPYLETGKNKQILQLRY